MKKIYYATGVLILIGLAYAIYAFFLDDKIKSNKNHVIMALGDSLTYGTGDRNEEGYVGQLEKKLNAETSSGSYKVENYGIPGQESEGVMKQLSDPKINEKVNEADQIIIYIGTNDLGTGLGGNFKTINKQKINAEKKDYLDNIEEILKSIRQLDEDVPILVLGLYNPFINDNKLDPILEDWNHDLKERINRYSFITYVPTNDLFQGKSKKEYFSDDIHLNHKGYRLIANRISEEIIRGYGKFTP